MEIEECLAAVSKGDMEALEELYAKMRVSIYGYVLSIVCDIKLAEDITQETFIHIYDKVKLYKKGGNPEGWIITLARNLAYDMLRKLKKCVVTEEVLDFNSEVYTEENFGRMDLNDALLKLEDVDRQIVVLKAVSGFTHAEIGLRLSIPEGTVKWKYRRVLKKLKGFIGGEAYGE